MFHVFQNHGGSQLMFVNLYNINLSEIIGIMQARFALCQQPSTIKLIPEQQSKQHSDITAL